MQTKYIDFIAENGEFFQIIYAYGKGQFSVNLEGMFNQFSSRDFKKLLEIVQELSASPFEIAEKLHDIVCLRLDHERSFSEQDEKLIKKIYGFLEQLRKHFGLEMPEDTPEKVTLKKSTVAARRTDKNGNPYIELLDGWTFKKCGYNFSVYKEPKIKERRYRVIISICGLSVCNTLFHTKEAAVNSITEEIIQLIEKNANNLKTATKDFRQLLTAAGYDYILNNPIYADIPTQEATECTETVKTVNNTTLPEKATEKAQKEPQGEAMPQPDTLPASATMQTYHAATGRKTARIIRHDIRPHRQAHNVKTAFYSTSLMIAAAENGKMIIDTS